MSISKEELLKEKQYLTNVKEVITKKMNKLNVSLEKDKDKINDMKKFMWDNLSDYTDEERAIALSDMDSNVDVTNLSIDKYYSYEKALNSPYFGKVTFKTASMDMDIYIGITSVDENLKFYVFDWRAPVSSLFYNYEKGMAKYDAPRGEISGEITSKMQFKIVDGELLRCFKSDINIDDEYLQEILSKSSNEKMQNIVSTIQREQNLVIRNDKDKYLVVQGIAGSGKTSVALHRIAYLLYKDKNLNSNNVLILSPNDVFSEYISDVLPELGEQNVSKTTFSEFAQSFLKPVKKIEEYSSFLERMYSTDSFDKNMINYKMSDDYKKDIDDYIENYERNIQFNKNITADKYIIPTSNINKLFFEKYKNFPYKERLEFIADNICTKLRLPKKSYFNRIKKTILDSSNITFSPIDLYEQFLNSKYYKEENCQFVKNKINYEDITPLLYIYFKINGYPNYSNIRQLVIDEVQDYTLFQIEILKNIFKSASFTLLGDINQTINPYYSYDSLQSLADIFDKSKYLELTKTYRSSEEIIDYSNKILDINNACSVRKNNNIPVKIESVTPSEIGNKISKDIEEMKNGVINRIAIITKNINTANKLNKILNNEEIQLITKSTDALSKKIVVIPSYLSKGLEFDGVIVYNDDENTYDDNEKKLYYVVCTRAQHQLNIYNEPKLTLKKN